MDSQELRRYLKTEIEEILLYRQVESDKHHHDITRNDAALMWIQAYAGEFRRTWPEKKNPDKQRPSNPSCLQLPPESR